MAIAGKQKARYQRPCRAMDEKITYLLYSRNIRYIMNYKLKSYNVNIK